MLCATYDHRPLCVVRERAGGDAVAGVAPFMLVRSCLTKPRLVSLPFTSYCDAPVDDTSLTEGLDFARHSVPEAASVLVKRLRPLPRVPAGFRANTGYMTHLISLVPDTDEVLRRFHPSQIRRSIRKGEKCGLLFRWSNDLDDMKAFYALLVKTRRRHGLPPPPWRFYGNMHKYLLQANLLRLGIVERNGVPLAAAIVITSRQTWHLEYQASDARAWPLKVNQTLVWELIKEARSAGAISFDMGRSFAGNKSLVEYKDRWGAVRCPLHYYSTSDRSGAPSEPSAWRRAYVAVNQRLPSVLLRWQGWLLYPHMS
jgi:CelD/BcsL family acetyltransferase involved in cellulose biosynthesis